MTTGTARGVGVLGLVLLLFVPVMVRGVQAGRARKIVLLAGHKSHGAGADEYEKDLRLFRSGANSTCRERRRWKPSAKKCTPVCPKNTSGSRSGNMCRSRHNWMSIGGGVSRLVSVCLACNR